MVNPAGIGIPGRSRCIQPGYWEQEIRKRDDKIKDLENKMAEMQELIDQYEWALGEGDRYA